MQFFQKLSIFTLILARQSRQKKTILLKKRSVQSRKIICNKIIALWVLLSVFCGYTNAADDILINRVTGEKEELILSILKLAWKQASPNGKIVQTAEELPVSRLPIEVSEKRLGLMWAGASAQNDEQMLAVRIPLLKGMLGHRIFIIKKGDQSRFNHIQTVADLSKLDAGMGSSWGSTKVLEQAGLKVVTTRKYYNLFDMLDGGRFDYFPRAIHEPWIEIENRKELPLEVEERILLVYPYAMYFYLQKENVALHAQLTKGLEAIIADGSLDELFYANSMVKESLASAHLGERIVLRIPNVAMHKDTPTDRPELWLDLNKLTH